MSGKGAKPKKMHGKSQSKLFKNDGAIAAIDLKRFCSKKLFEIELAAPRISADTEGLNRIVAEGKKFDYLSLVYFITYDDVLDFMKQLLKNKEDMALPLFIKETLQNEYLDKVSKCLDNLKLFPSNMLAQIVKLKIIETMYKQYSSEVRKMKKRQHMTDELSKLIDSKECDESAEKSSNKSKKKGKGKDKKSKSKSKSSKGSSKGKPKKGKNNPPPVVPSAPQEEIVQDYTEIILEENDIIYDYNVDNQTIFFILVGFEDSLLFKELARINIVISAILEVSLQSSDTNIKTPFLSSVYEILDKPQTCEYLEGTVHMKFKTNNQQGLLIKETLEEFLYVVKRINYIKRQHLMYLRHLKLFNFGPPLKKLLPKCLVKYNTILNDCPMECVNIALILDALIEEVCWREHGLIYSVSDLSASSSSSLSYCAEKNMTKHKLEIEQKTFQVHEEDTLTIILKTFKSAGRQIYDTTLKYLKSVQNAVCNKPPEHQECAIRTRTIGTPLEYDDAANELRDIKDYIHLALFHATQRNIFTPKIIEEDDFNRDLIIYNESEAVLESSAKIIGDVNISKTKKTGDSFHNVLQNYHIKEDLSSTVLSQLIYKALLQFECCDKIFLPLTNSVLLRFHDNIDEYGIETRIWNQSLKTPVCLRDFCKYITVNDQLWLQENKISDHLDVKEQAKKEECEGMQDLKIAGIYEEYSYLFASEHKEIDDVRRSVFNEKLNELIGYPRAVSSDFCSKPDEPFSFYAYNLGQKQLQLRGDSNIFHSYDGVKVTVDNSRFLTEDPKCCIKIATAGHTFVFHSQDSSNFHFVLKDETILFFSKQEGANNKSHRKPPDRNKTASTTSTEKLANNNKTVSDDNLTISSNQTNSLTSLMILPDFKIMGISKTNLPKFLLDFEKDDVVSIDQIRSKDKIFDGLLELFKLAVQNQKPIYKVAVKPPTRHVKKVISPTGYQFSGIMNRVLCKSNSKFRYRGHSIRTQNKLKNQTSSISYHLQISVPNGISITALPKTIDFVEIKQSNKSSKSAEEYRLFYKNGVVLVKNSNGITKIMRSNGDIIELTDKVCHEKNCARNMVNLFRKTEEKQTPFFPSRYERPAVKKDSEFILLYEFGDIPYAKKSILSFDGKQTVEFNGKVTEQQLHYVVYEDDYYTEEKCFKRDDGFRCIVGKGGRRLIQFPDGTKISSWYEIEKDLIFVGDRFKGEGWVSVVISYEIEHHDYASLIFDSHGKSTQIFINDSKIKISDESITMCLGSTLASEITTENIVLLKNCNICNSDCMCKINLQNGSDELKLLEVYDSYNKIFVSDYYGNCHINSDYIRGALNKNNCDHRFSCDLEKFFVLNAERPGGSLLWSNNQVERKMIKSLNDPNVRVSNYYTKSTMTQVIEIYTNVYENFREIFNNSQIYNNKKIRLTRKTVKKDVILYYVTFRVLSELQNPMKYNVLCKKITKFLDCNTTTSTDLRHALSNLWNFTSMYNADIQEKQSFRANIQKQESKMLESEEPEKVESVNKVKMLAQDIVAGWQKRCAEYRDLIRNKKFVPYFHSDYYLNKEY